MAMTREIPEKEWREFLPTFSERNRGHPVRLETMIPSGEGEPVLAECRPLMAVDFDRKGSEAPAMMVTVGGLEAKEPTFTHVVNDPTRLWVDEEAPGRAVGMAIESREEGRTLLIFEPEEALPEHGIA